MPKWALTFPREKSANDDDGGGGGDPQLQHGDADRGVKTLTSAVEVPSFIALGHHKKLITKQSLCKFRESPPNSQLVFRRILTNEHRELFEPALSRDRSPRGQFAKF